MLEANSANTPSALSSTSDSASPKDAQVKDKTLSKGFGSSVKEEVAVLMKI